MRTTAPVLLLSLLAGPASAQGVVVDEGSFAISVQGRVVGQEDFAIRRSGRGSAGTLIASGSVTLEDAQGSRSMQVVLSANPADGTAQRYQVDLSGPSPVEVRLSLVGRRYVALTRSDAGQEERELPAEPRTRVLESEIAHHYYFLRDVGEGERASAIEPRTRRRFSLEASAPVSEELQLGRNAVTARRVVFTGEAGRRIVWFDRQGRVLRVEIPDSGYVAERTDLVG